MKIRDSVAMSCSVPSGPAAVSCSERLVNPEMSTSTGGALDVEAPLGVVRDPVQQARDQRGGRDRDAQALPLPPWGLLRRMAGRDPAAPDPEGWCAGWGVASVPGEGRGPAPPDRGG